MHERIYMAVWISLAVCILVGLALPAPGAELALDPGGETPYEGEPLVIEAERYHSNHKALGFAWTQEAAEAGFKGPGYLQALPRDGAGRMQNTFTGPHADYAVRLTAGTWYPWLRAFAPDANTDSAHIGLDGEANTTADRISSFEIGKWSWSNATMDGARASLEVAADGLYHLNLWMREAGLAVDRIVLSADPTYTPQGEGPEESAQAGDWASPAIILKATGEPLHIFWTAQSDASWYELRMLLEDGAYTPIRRTTQSRIDIPTPKSRVIVVQLRAGNDAAVSAWATSTDPSHATLGDGPQGWIIVARPAPPTDPVIE